MVFRIAGAIPAKNYLHIPRSHSAALRISGRYLYMQLWAPASRTFSVHVDALTADNLTVRISFSNIHKVIKVQVYHFDLMALSDKLLPLSF